MIQTTLTSPEQEAALTRENVLRYGGEKDTAMLELIGAVTLRTMQAALEDPAGELEWSDRVWSSVDPSDLEGLDDEQAQRLQAVMLVKPFWAAKLLAWEVLVPEEVRLFDEKRQLN